MKFNQIKETLYQKYYKGEGYSKVTSSHWRNFGGKTTVTKNNHDFEINAYGISDYHERSLLGKLKHLPIDILLAGLMKKYNSTKNTIFCAKNITNHLNIHFDIDHAKHVLIYDLIHSNGLFNPSGFICIIGDGHGFLGTLIKTIIPDAKILFINLGRNLLIDIICFSRVFPDVESLHLQQSEDVKFMDNHSIIFLEAEHYELMKKLPISLFINIDSMQEMDMFVIQNYFKYMRTSSVEAYFYCCNREEKILPDGNVIMFAAYPWGRAEILLDEICPWNRRYPSIRPPFWHPLDGPVRHRLVKLNKSKYNVIY